MTLTIAGVGDLVTEGAPWAPRPRAARLRDLSMYDLSIGNLEVPLTRRAERGGPICLHGQPEVAFSLRDEGVDIAGLANNHVLDQGFGGLDETAQYLADVGIGTVGWGVDASRAIEPVVVGIRGADVAVVAFSCIAAERCRPGEGLGIASLRFIEQYDRRQPGDEPGRARYPEAVPHEEDLASILGVVRRASQQATAVVVSVHWGASLEQRVLGYQRPLGQVLLEAGATVVFGHHSHLLQGIEIHRGRPIFYGLGSAVFRHEGPFRARVPDDSAVALVDIDERTGAVTATRLALGALDSDGLPVRVDAPHGAAVAEPIIRQSAALGTRIRRHGDELHAEPAHYPPAFRPVGVSFQERR